MKFLRKFSTDTLSNLGIDMDQYMDRVTIISKLLGCILLSLTVGFIGIIFFAEKYETFYLTLDKPFYFPPDWLLISGRVIGLLLLGTSLFLVITADNDQPKNIAFGAFGIQVVLNIFWWVLTFGVDSDWFGVVELWLLILVNVWMAREFYRIKPLAGYILVPYIAWLCYISILDISLAILN